MIEFVNVCKKYGEFTALNNINIKINDGEIFGLVGESGAGKSTLLRTINQLERVESGSIIVNGTDVTALKGKTLRMCRKNIGMIFQHFSLMETRNVFKNIALPLECNKNLIEVEISKNPFVLYKRRKKWINDRVIELAKIVGIEDKLKSRPKELSGGQKQRVAIARSLAMNPSILLCDEATSALDPQTTKGVLEVIKEINKTLGLTVVIVTHQMEVVKDVCERIAVLDHGNLLEIGKTSEMFLNAESALKPLIAEDEILPKTGVNVRLLFSDESSKDAVITQMARTLNIDFSICWGKLERFQNDVLGSLIINVNEDDLENVKKFLSSKNVRWEVVRDVNRSC